MGSRAGWPQDFKANELKMKNRIKELEGEVACLKRRLDELRKAKNTTILKREREVIEVGLPFGKRDSPITEKENADIKRKLQQLENENAHEIEALQKKFEAEIGDLKKNSKNLECNHMEELLFLRNRNESLENENVVLTAQNQDLMARVDSLITELSEKEAHWCDLEENLNLKIKMSWGEKYKEWMDATEAKIEELQKTNQLLRTYLKKSKPQSSELTGQEPDLDAL